MMLRKVLLLGALLAIAPVVALGCGDDGDGGGSSGGSAAVPNQQGSVDPTFGHRLKCTDSPTMAELLNYQVPKAKEPYKITLMEVSLAGYYYQGIKVGAEQAAKEAGVELTTVAAKGYVSPEQQLGQLETAIQRKTDGIVFAPSDYKGSIPVVQQAKAADIPVVNISTEIATGDGVKKVLQDDYLLGRLAADDVAKNVGAKGSGIIIAGPANADWSRKRAAGFKDQVKEKYPNMKIVASPTQLVDPQAGLKSFEDALQANPDIDWIYSVHYFILPPKSVPERYRGKVPYVSAGLEPDSIKALEDGSLKSVLAIQPILMGKMGVGEVIKEIEGQSVPDVTCVPAPRFTKADVGSPAAEIQLIPGSVK